MDTVGRHTYRSFAKVNLYLDVLNRRRDGFHDIETIFQTVSLCDELTVAPAGTLTLTCSNPNLETGPGNLVWRAATLLREVTGCTAGAALHLEKKIPLAAGLAGGSGDAAATLIGLNGLWDLGLTARRLARLALRLGSDVPYCLHGGTVAARGRGEQMADLPALPRTWMVLVHPDREISAAEAYGHPGLVRNLEPRFAGWTRGLRAARWALLKGQTASVVRNTLADPLIAQYPELGEIRESLKRLGCAAAAVSGSGPTVFGLCAGEEEAHRVAKALTGVRTTVVHTVSHGVTRA